ncbi:MAG: uroporphyrinogen decarboxylase family protein [Armatimonadia bacterium]
MPLHDQVSFNPAVVAYYTGRAIEGFDYGLEDICAVIRQTLDMCFPPSAPRGIGRWTSEDGFTYRNDNWTTWRVSRPFTDVSGARAWLQRRVEALSQMQVEPAAARVAYREKMEALQRLVGDTVICEWSAPGFASMYDAMGLELFVYLCDEDPQLPLDFMELSTQRELERVAAVADPALSPVILIPDDFATKQGPIFSPEFLGKCHFPFVAQLTQAWQQRDVHVLYHSDGNYRKVIPQLIGCGVEGFYCLEPGVGMEIAGLKREWPRMVWAGGVDGVDLMERGTPEQVRAEVRRQIVETDALSGGVFIGTSSEINPPIKVENFVAMVEAVGETTHTR